MARKLDQKYHGTQPGTIGPIEARLREYGKPDEHAVSGLVLGAFGELSTDCYSLAYAIARVKAIKYCRTLTSSRKMLWPCTNKPFSVSGA